MSKKSTPKSGAFRLLLKVGPLLVLVFTATIARAGSATWNLNPTSSDWNTAANWTPATVPDSTTDTATFAFSNTTDISLSGTINVASIIFDAGASPYSFAAPSGANLLINGAGIINNSGEVQTFSVPTLEGAISFLNGASAGDMMAYTGSLGFSGTSNAGSSSFTITGSSEGVFSDTSNAAEANFTVGENTQLQFQSSSNAGTATFSVQPAGDAVGTGGLLYFRDSSSAANATITAEGSTIANPNGRALVDFVDTSSGGNATIIAQAGSNGGEGGHISFELTSNGGTAQIELFGSGQLDISALTSTGTSIGSIQGDGLIFLGQRRLTVGDALDTTFSGVIQDGGVAGGSGGGVIKSGTGTLTLTGNNTYTGNTIIAGGTLLVNSRRSGTGTGSVNLNAGTLGGNGKIAGSVTIGDAVTGNVTLAPAAETRRNAILSIGKTLTFASNGIYKCLLLGSGGVATSDQTIARGVTINSGAQFTFTSKISGTLQSGTTFTIISNTASAPIRGTFSNLADGALVGVGRFLLKASYEGGDGNDLTLTVQ